MNVVHPRGQSLTQASPTRGSPVIGRFNYQSEHRESGLTDVFPGFHPSTTVHQNYISVADTVGLGVCPVLKA